ncbi:hypothetical protein P3S67_013342 [Capsicum chacoense]
MVSSAMTQTNTTTDQLAILSLKSQIISDPFTSRMKRVKSLNLSNLDLTLTGKISREFGNLSFLTSLDLGSNNFHENLPQQMRREGHIPVSLSNTSRLETLLLSENLLQGYIPKEIGSLHYMNLFSIQYNQLTGSIPLSVFNISRIEVIAFTGNSLSGKLPNGLCNGLPKLKGLYLSINKLHCHIPTSLSNCSQLQLLGLSENDFDGPIHRKIGRLSNLQQLYLGTNHFTVLSLGSNNLVGFLPRDIGNLTKMQLLYLDKNRFTGRIHKEMSNVIDLPPNMCYILPNIKRLYLMNLSNLVGTIPHSISNCSELKILELSHNKLTGLIPNSLGYLTHLQFLNLGGNNLTSDSSLSFLTSLTNCRNLTFLAIYLNPLNGMLLVSVGNLSATLIKIYADSCKIKGRIPNAFGNLSSLLFLDLPGDNLVGSIPISFGNLDNLERFDLSHYKFTGFIGDNLCKLKRLGAIYFSQNQFSGSLQNCLGNVTSLRDIYLDSNKLSSNIPSSLWNLKDLMVLDLSSNNMIYLAHLSLRHNKLQGSIPDSISNIVGLEFLDLSDNDNNISGTIPKSLEKFQNLKYFNVSANKLYGEIPSRGPFKNLSSQFFIYNEALCGSSRFSVPPCSTSSKLRSNRKRVLILLLLLGIVLLFFAISFVLAWIRYRRATDGLSESNLIGFRSFGSVYKGVLRSGTSIAVKVFNLQLDAAFKSFDMEY